MIGSNVVDVEGEEVDAYFGSIHIVGTGVDVTEGCVSLSTQAGA